MNAEHNLCLVATVGSCMEKEVEMGEDDAMMGLL